MRRRGARTRFEFRRELLLVEVERRCRECGAAARLGLTKAEARAYQGFECETCEAWNDDDLTERDIPEWWEELRVTGLAALRPASPAQARRPVIDSDGAGSGEETEVVRRLSDEWRRGRGGGDSGAPGEEDA